MKILLTMNLPYTRVHGGANKSNRCLAEELARRGHEVCVVVPALATPSSLTRAQFLEQLAEDGVEVLAGGAADVFDMQGVNVHAVTQPAQLRSYLIEQLNSFNPDWALVSSEDPSQNLLAAALKTCPSRVVYLAHTPQMFPFGPASLYPGKKRAELVGEAAAVVTISKVMADYVRQWSGYEAFVNHPPHFGAAPFPNFGRFDEGYALLLNACPVKGISILLGMAREMPDVAFAAVPGYGTTSEDRAALEACPNIDLLPNRKSADAIFSQTRVLLMPSLWVEGFGMATVDAMARGIPVLASNFGGLVEAKLGTDYLLPVRPIERFENHLDENLLPSPVVPEQEVAPWCAALRDLLADRKLYERQSASARAAATKFIEGLSVAPLEDLLTRLSRERHAGAARAPRSSQPPSHASYVSEMSDLPEAVAALTPEQRSLLMLRLKKKAALRAESAAAGPRIPRAARDGSPLALSFAQQRLWFLHQVESESPFYNVPAAVRLRGRLDVEALERTLTEVVRRHEVLRTTFSVTAGRPVQLIHDPYQVQLPLTDLSAFAQSEREAEAHRVASVEARLPFDLGRGPLLRARLLRLSADEHVAVLVMHHIVSDGWSMGVLVREVAALYAAYARGEASPLAELPVQYADFAAWQRGWLTGEALERQLGYWRERLTGAPPVLELPTDRPRPHAPTWGGASYSFSITGEAARLRAFARAEGATSFMTLLAAFKVFLHRYSSMTEIVCGSPIAGRNLGEIENSIGFFVNTLVLRTDLGGNPTFRELLRRVKETALGAYAHQDVPFEKLVEELQPERDLSRNPLFQVLFALQNGRAEQLELPGLHLEFVKLGQSTSQFDLSLLLEEQGDELGGQFNYSTDLFDASTVERMAGHFQRLLGNLLADPDQTITAAEMLDEEEQRQLIVGALPSDQAHFEINKCLHEEFAEQARRTPDAPALSYDGEFLSYAQLDARASRLAAQLRRHGV
ncbi:MAG TPA: condensation domain-containing protein, partial [Pyrinomonadaceae bacterium]|nr:condensation domain-containing protein [Pyrinomonadaceae bacterium]